MARQANNNNNNNYRRDDRDDREESGVLSWLNNWNARIRNDYHAILVIRYQVSVVSGWLLVIGYLLLVVGGCAVVDYSVLLASCNERASTTYECRTWLVTIHFGALEPLLQETSD